METQVLPYLRKYAHFFSSAFLLRRMSAHGVAILCSQRFLILEMRIIRIILVYRVQLLTCAHRHSQRAEPASK